MAVPAACGAAGYGGTEGREYRRYCRLRPSHPGRKHRDGDYEWGDGTSDRPAAPLDEDDIGQGEGCEGGKCAIRSGP